MLRSMLLDKFIIKAEYIKTSISRPWSNPIIFIVKCRINLSHFSLEMSLRLVLVYIYQKPSKISKWRFTIRDLHIYTVASLHQMANKKNIKSLYLMMLFILKINRFYWVSREYPLSIKYCEMYYTAAFNVFIEANIWNILKFATTYRILITWKRMILNKVNCQSSNLQNPSAHLSYNNSCTK